MESVLLATEMCYFQRMLCQVGGLAHAKAWGQDKAWGFWGNMSGGKHEWNRGHMGQACLSARLMNLGTMRCFKHTVMVPGGFRKVFLMTQ